MEISYDEILKLSGDDFWKTLEKESQAEIEWYINNRHDGKPLSSEEQKTEYQRLLEEYNKDLESPASRGGISAFTDVYKWFGLQIDEFSEEVDYYLICNMVTHMADIEKYNALQYGDEWLANQYDLVNTVLY